MKIMLQTALAAGLVAAFSLNAFAADQPEGRRDIARYEKAAGQTVTEMPLQSLVDWQALGDQSVAVWTANDKPWLVKVETPCDIGLSRAVLDAAAGIHSDYDCREVLVALARVMPNDAELIARYRDVARHLSNYERGEAERALDRFTS